MVDIQLVHVHESTLCQLTRYILSSDDVISHSFIINPYVHVVIATKSSGERDLDDAVAGGRGRFNDVRYDSGNVALVDHPTPQAVRGLEQVGRLIVAHQLWIKE